MQISKYENPTSLTIGQIIEKLKNKIYPVQFTEYGDEDCWINAVITNIVVNPENVDSYGNFKVEVDFMQNPMLKDIYLKLEDTQTYILTVYGWKFEELTEFKMTNIIGEMKSD